MTELITQ